VTPFQQFRLWARRAPVSERVSASIAAAVVLALLVWVLVPASTNKSSGALRTVSGNGATSGAGSSTATTAAGNTAPGAATAASGVATNGSGSVGTPAAGGGSAGAPTPSGAAAGSGAASATPAGPAGCVSPPGSDQGVTDSQIKMAISVTNIVGPAGNDTFGVPSVEEQNLDYQQVIDSINASGGVACRKIVAKYYTANPASDDDKKQKCLDIVQFKPFFVIDAGGFYGSPLSNCFPQNHLPFLGTGRLAKSQRDQFYPYLFDRGFFSPANGFKKLGFLYRDCFGDVNTQFLAALSQVGVPSSQISSYNFGCPTSNFSSPADIQQAVLQFKRDGVTHVTESQFYPDFANFTNLAQQQGLKPKYGVADDGLVPISTSKNLGVNYDNTDGMIAITGDRYGEQTTPGLSPTAGTQKCNAIFAAKGRPPVYQQPVGLGGVACSQLWMMEAAIKNAPTLERTSLAAGLQAAKSIDLSYPRGPANFTGPKVTYGGEFWRPEQLLKSCQCWRVLDATFKPSFP
jgi:hypothetical protein